MIYQKSNFIFLLFVSFFLISCGQLHEIEFSTVPSNDGQTYILIKDDNNESCHPLVVNGKRWEHPYNIPVSVSPGIYKLTCKLNELEITIEQGVTLIYLTQAKPTQ
jgi:hypothetical protein